jgi:hypothetical protein
LRPWAGSAYYLFWQAYAGGFDPGRVRALFPSAGWVAGAAAGLGLVLGLAEGSDGRLSLTGRGFDRYHDLERRVTYRFIEPLWEEMMAEHYPEAQPAASVE